MEKTNVMSTTRWKAVGAAACAAALCLYLAAFSAGSLNAYAGAESGDEVASLSGTVTETRYYYAPIGALENTAYSMSGGTVRLPISAGQSIALEVLLEFDVAMNNPPDGINDSECERRSISVIITTPESAEPESTDDDSVDTTEPQTTQKPSISTTAPTTESETAPTVPGSDTAAPTIPEQQSAPEQALASDESELLKLVCYESETEQKVAELTEQGYEIVRIEKMPDWWR